MTQHIKYPEEVRMEAIENTTKRYFRINQKDEERLIEFYLASLLREIRIPLTDGVKTLGL